MECVYKQSFISLAEIGTMATKLIRVNVQSQTGNDNLDALINPVKYTAFFRGRVWRLTGAWIRRNKCFQNLYYMLSAFPWEKITSVHGTHTIARVIVRQELIVRQEDILAVASFSLVACPFRVIRYSLEMGEAVNKVFSEIQQGRRLAVMMASHPRLGGESSLSLPAEVIVSIAKHVGGLV